MQNTLTTAGWTGWKPGGANNRQVTVQDIAAFARLPGVIRGRGATGRLVALTPHGERVLRNPRYAHLAPLFDRRRNQLYHITEPGGGAPGQSHYIGMTDRAPGLRIVEHLRSGNDLVHPQLQDAAQRGRLDRLRVEISDMPPNDGKLTHWAEVTLQQLHQSDWNDPSKLGFDEEAFAYAW